MADMKQDEFYRRLEGIERKHKSLSGGYVRLEERNGILTPVQKVRPKRAFPWRGLFLVALAFILFKATLFAHLGPIGYIRNHAELEQGGVVERMGAWILRPDPVTIFIADKIDPVVNAFNFLDRDTIVDQETYLDR